jgi:hypothetical protein
LGWRRKKMKTDCERLKESSVYIRDWIARQPVVKEESLTDWLLYDISRQINGIIYRAFSRHEEARVTGADWEWWFLLPDFSAKMRVQAKKVDPGNDNYATIAYTNKYGLQIEKLIQDADAKNFLPFYAFYTCLQEPVMCQQRVNDEGVFMAGANQVYGDFVKGGKRPAMPKDILAKSIALSCFLCCPLQSEGRGSRGFIRFMSKYYSSEIGRVPEGGEELAREPGRGIYKEIPSYVTALVEHAQEGLPDWWEQEFRGYIEGVNSIVVYDARQRG